MSKYAAIVVFLLAACGPEPKVANRPVVGSLVCPTLPATSGYTVQSVRGVDYVICQLKPTRGDTPLAELYIGNFPANDEGMRFAGFSSGKRGPLAWFSIPKTADQPARLVTFIPTQEAFPAVIKLTVQGSNSRALTQQRETLASLVLASRHEP